MTIPNLPHFVINNNYQKKKSDHYSDFLTEDILRDICYRITGLHDFTYDFVNEVNVGKLALLEYNNTKSYILIPDLKNDGRNSYFQSFPTSLARYYSDSTPNKNIYFYFLPFEGNNNTDYYRFMYRLMATAGVQYLNPPAELLNCTISFNTIQDIVAGRQFNGQKNKSNKPTYITKNTDNIIEIFGKTYGANKKETTLICLALSVLLDEPAKLYIICEQNLVQLPAPDLAAINSLGKIEVIPTTLTMEQHELSVNSNLRSARFIYNLLSKLGPKKCSFCDCDIPQLIQGAHIWPVSSIKDTHHLTIEEKLEHTTNEDNGIWLCENHHKLFDENLLTIDINGSVNFADTIAEANLTYLTAQTTKMNLEPSIINEKVEFYITQRYK